jgi:hypothetical protein
MGGNYFLLHKSRLHLLKHIKTKVFKRSPNTILLINELGGYENQDLKDKLQFTGQNGQNVWKSHYQGAGLQYKSGIHVAASAVLHTIYMI